MEREIFFIVGFPRSGTSMLVQLLNEHPAITVQHESKFIPAYYPIFLKKAEAGKFPQIIDDLNQELSNKARFTGQVSEVELQDIFSRKEMYSRKEQMYGDVVYSIFSNVPKRKNYPLIGDKTPSYVFHIPFLKEIFPKAKFIHLIRDGRDAFVSIKDLSWGPGNVYFSALEWNKYLSAWDKHSAQLEPSDKFTLQYEDLLRSPEKELERTCSFLSVPYKSAYFSKFKLKANNSFKWENKFNMRSGEVSIFQSLALNYLQKYNYPIRKGKLKNWWILIPFFYIDQVWKYLYNKVLQSKWMNANS